jgi:hypothetical protein
MEQQTVEVTFQGELGGSHSDDCATYTLYPRAERHVLGACDKGEES